MVDRRFIFSDAENEHFVALMRKPGCFLGFRASTYLMMANHFHLLVEEADEETFISSGGYSVLIFRRKHRKITPL